MLSTYHLYKIYWLSAVGEYTAMAFLPLIPAALYELYGDRPLTRKRLRRACAELVAAFGMLLQVHLLSLEMAVLATAVFCLMRFRRTFSKAVFFTWLKAAVLTVLLNLWFLVPFLTLMLSGDYNNMYTGSAENGGQIVKNSGLRIAELFGWQKNHNNLGPELLAGGFVLLWCWLTLRAKEKPQQPERRSIRLGLWAAGFAALACWMSTNTFPWQAVGRIRWWGVSWWQSSSRGGIFLWRRCCWYWRRCAGWRRCGRSAMRGRWRCSLWGYRFSARRFSSATSRPMLPTWVTADS